MKQGSKLWISAAFFVGVVATGTQIVLLREVLAAYFGNELIIGVVLFDWLALTGAGAVMMGRWQAELRPIDVVPVVLAILLFLPPITFVAFRFFPLYLAPAGSMPEIGMFLLSSAIALMPICVASGASFAALARIAVQADPPTPVGVVYAWEGAGSLVGGVLFGLLLFDVISSPKLLFVISAAAGMVGAFVFYASGRKVRACALLVAAATVGMAPWFFSVDRLGWELRYPGHALVALDETPFGTLTATRLSGQVSVFSNNVPIIAGDDVQGNEETVHPVLAQRPVHPRVLIVGGNPAGLDPEALKYPGAEIWSIEENRWMRDIERVCLPLQRDGRVNCVEGDIRQFLSGANGRFDAVLLVVPEPSSVQTNRFYTIEMLNLLRHSMAPGGVLCLSLQSSGDYAGPEARLVRSILRNTLASEFRNVIVVPLGRDLFLASDSLLRGDIGSAVGDAHVPTVYANADYLPDDLLAGRIARMSAGLQGNTPINTDDRPALMLAQIRYWMNYFSAQSWVPPLLFMLLLLVLVRPDRESFGLMSAGCVGIILELMVVMILQVAMGNAYKMVGLFVGVYMAGMSLGAFVVGRFAPSRAAFLWLQGGMTASLLLPPLIQPLMAQWGSSAIVALTLCLGAGSFCAGGIFSVTAGVLAARGVVASGGRLYAVDLMGSAVGALVVGPLLLPLLGTRAVALLAAGIVVTGATVAGTSRYWRPHAQT
jgi:spermidine synthase